jgi:N-methylhydantoinase B
MTGISDPVLLEVLNNAFRSIAEEMGRALTRAAYSPNIRDRKDCSCAVFDKTGRLISQAEHIPAHLGPMAASILAVFGKYSEGDLSPGDVIMYNDSYIPGGSHLPDITVISPVFDGGVLAFFAANRGHHNDVGGISPGSQGANAREIFQDGLRIPVLKIQQRGELDEELLEFICLNVRTPAERRGDIMAQIAANNVGAARLSELCSKYGFEQLSAYIDGLIEYSENVLRKQIEGIPDGVYQGEDFLESDEEPDGVIRIKASLDIRGDSVHVDFTGSHPQVRSPYNMPPDQSKTAVYYAFKCIGGESLPFNFGIFKPLSFTLPPGTIVNPLPPAPTSFCTTESSNRVADVILRALSQAIPDRITAGWATTRNIIALGGMRKDSEQMFVHMESFGGGQGARPTKDGMDGVPPHCGNTANTPTEIMEAVYPLLVLRYGLVRESEGPGKFRGGLGVTRVLKILEGNNMELSFVADRRRIPPYGLFGGLPGKPGEDYLIRNNQKGRIRPKCVMDVFPNDIIVIQTPGGGGIGSPLERDPCLVLKDVQEGFISPERAKKEYGVVVDDNLEVDIEKTTEYRASMIRADTTA